MSLFLKTIGILYVIAAAFVFYADMSIPEHHFSESFGFALVIPWAVFIFPPAWIVTGIYFAWCIFVHKPNIKVPTCQPQQAPPDAR